MKLAEASEELKRIDRDIAGYIGVLIAHRAELRNADAKILLMQRRYLQRFEWNDICYELFGDNRDYAARHNYYRRKMFRLHDSACSAIWDWWQTVGNGVPLQSSKGIQCQIWTARTDD